MNVSPTKRLVYMAFLISLSIILTRLFSLRIPIEGMEGLRIGFGTLPLIIAGLLFGPYYGAVVGILSDVVGFHINPMGPFLPHFTAIAALHGILPPLLLKLTGAKPTIFALFIAIGFTQCLTALVLVPYCLSLLFGIPFVVTLPGRIVSQTLLIPAYILAIRSVFTSLQAVTDRKVILWGTK